MLISWFIVALLAISRSSASIGKEKRTYSVLQINPKSEDELRFLSALYINDDEMLDFWKPPTVINNTVDVMVYPGFRDKLNRLFEKTSIQYRVVVDDVAQYLTDSEETATSKLFGGERRLRDESSKKDEDLQLGQYHSYDDIVWWLKSLERRHPDIVKVTSIGVTPEGRTIYGVKLGTKHINATRVVWIDAGIHAREWASVHTALYFIRELVSEYYRNPKIAEYLNLLDIYIYPCINPDGYEYTRSDPNNPEIRLWRKNRGSVKHCMWKDGKKRCCKGVDLNRNFAFHFAVFCPAQKFITVNEHLVNRNQGRAVRDAVLSLSNRMDAYISLHTYSQLWVYPYSNKKFAYSPDVDDLKAVAKKAVESLGKLYGTQYRYGTGPEIISWNGFILDRRQLIPTGRETYEGVKVVIDNVIAADKLRRGIAPACKDQSKYCAFWKKQNPGICTSVRTTMEAQCKKTCSFC